VNAASNFARRLVEKYGLEPPIDIEHLVSKYADLKFADIPFDGADGISLNLKVIGKTTRVIVNQNMPAARQRFTMAHELGHVIIPWHVGTIIDHLDPEKAGETGHYWEVEEEANTFGAALLMPQNFIDELVAEENNLARVNLIITKECEVSPIASAIRLSSFMASNVIYAYERNNVVEFSGKSTGTIASPLNWGSEFPDEPYDYAVSHFQKVLNGGVIHWWVLPSEIHFDIEDDRSWRDILNGMVNDIGVDPSLVQKFKSSVNGVVAYANGSCKKSDSYTVGSVVSASVQRFKDRGGFESFVLHPDFKAFLVKKAQELVCGNR
jgi:Zn-dependent peptidase ImmA (M78 family)